MSYSHDVSDWTVPAVDSAEHVAGFELRLIANPKQGLPALSSVNATNGVEESWPKPASKACCGVQLLPLSSEYEIQSVWNDCSMLTLHPVAFCARSAAIQATKMRPAWAVPGGAMPTPAGTVLQNV